MQTVSNEVVKLLQDLTIQKYINNSQWEDLYNYIRREFYLIVSIKHLTELYDLFTEARLTCPEPPEAQLLHKYLNAEGTLNNNVEVRAVKDNVNYRRIYWELIPYIGKKVKVLDLEDAKYYDRDNKIDTNFAWLFWKVRVEGFDYNPVICGDCIDFPQYGIKNYQPFVGWKNSN